MSTQGLLQPVAALGGLVARGWTELEHVLQAAAERRRLPEMDDRMLKDLGISRAQAEFEVSRRH